MSSNPSPEVVPNPSSLQTTSPSSIPQSSKLDVEIAALETAALNEFLPPLGIWTHLSGLIMLAGFGAAVAWASVTQYNVIVKAPAVVRPAGELRLVQATMEGTVKQIAVQENQPVRQGDAIAVLEDSQLQIKGSQLQSSIQQNQSQLTQIAAQLQALNAKITAETTAMQRSITSAQAELRRDRREYQELQISTETELKEAIAALSLAQNELAHYRSLGESDSITQLQIKEKESAVQMAQARLERARSKLNPSNATVALAEEKIALAEAQGKSVLASLGQQQKALLQQQLNIQSQIDKDQRDLKQLEIDRQKTIVRASATGTILNLELRNPGQFVRSGDAIAQIAPANTSLLIKARVKTGDVANIQVCQATDIQTCKQGKVFLRVSAYSYTDYGTLTGAVRAIAPDVTTPSEATQVNTSISYYEVTIEPEKFYLERNQQQYPIKAGMDVAAEIVAKEETLLNFILRKARLLTNL